MKKIFLIVILGIFLINLVSAFPICVDKTPPSAPSSLSVTSSGNDLILNWHAATDIPACSGIDYYVISRDGNQIGNTPSNILTYTDVNVPYGTYNYTVFAVDKIGHKGGPAIKIEIKTEPSQPPVGGRGGTRVIGGEAESSYVCIEKWQCSDWSECASPGVQTRICTDLNSCGTTLNKPAESQDCMLTEKTTSTGFLGPTGAAIGNFVKSGGGIATILVLITIVVLSIAITSMKKKKLTKEQKTKEF